MPAERFFVNSPLEVGCEIELTGDELTHLRRVMRKEVGDSVEIVNGSGDLAKAQITSFTKRHVTLSIQTLHHTPLPSYTLILAQGLPRMQRLEDLIEKCTEIGVSEFWLFPGELSEKRELSANNWTRLKSITISAMKQCGRLYLPKFKLCPPLSQWKSLPKNSFLGI